MSRREEGRATLAGMGRVSGALAMFSARRNAAASSDTFGRHFMLVASTHGSKEEADRVLAAHRGQEGSAGGRVIESATRPGSWHVEAFHVDPGADAHLPDGAQRSYVPNSEHARMGIVTPATSSGGGQVLTGPSGGRYKIGKSGGKVYVKKA